MIMTTADEYIVQANHNDYNDYDTQTLFVQMIITTADEYIVQAN
jgi:hypothetical protein